jgi:hypothetical protein
VLFETDNGTFRIDIKKARPITLKKISDRFAAIDSIVGKVTSTDPGTIMQDRLQLSSAARTPKQRRCRAPIKERNYSIK